MAIIVPIVSAWNPAGLNKAIADIKRAEGGLNKFSAGMQGIGKQMQNVGMSLSTKITLPLTILGAVSIRTAADFQVAMAQVSVATDTPVAGLKNLSDLAKKLGADTIFSANEAAQAMLELAKAGINPAEIQAGALKNTLDLAAASGMGLAESAIVMSAGMNTFKVDAKDSVKIVDALAGAANASAADVVDIAQALSQVGQQAVASGLSIQETTAALAAFSDSGIRGSDAGTSFKTFLQKLVPITGRAANEVKRLGLEFFDSNGNMKGLVDISGELEKAFTGMTQKQKLSSMQIIFGSDSLRAANVLYTEGAAGIQTYMDATTKSGAAADMAAARQTGLSGAIEQMKGSIETAVLTIGENLAPTIKAMAGRIQSLANSFTSLSVSTQSNIVKFGLFLAVVGPTVLLLGAFAVALGNIAVAMRLVAGWTAALRVQAMLMGTAYTQAGIAGVFSMAMIQKAMIRTGIGALIVGLGFLIEKLISLKKTADSTAQSLNDVTRAESVSSKFAPGWRKDIKAGRELQQLLDDLGLDKDDSGGTTKASDATSKAAAKAAKAGALVKAALDNMSSGLKNATDKLQSARDAFNAFKLGVSQAITGIINFTQAATAETGSFVDNLVSQAAKAADFGTKVQQLIKMGLSESALAQVLASGADAGTKIADEIIAGGATIVDQVNTLITATDSVAKQLADAMPAEFFKAGITAGEALVQGIKDAIAAAGFAVSAAGEVVNQAGVAQVAKQLAKYKKSGGKLTKKERGKINDLATSLGVAVPKMAAGGIVNKPTLALIGEAGPEAVIPLTGRNAGMGTNITINVTAGMGADGNQIGRQIVDAIKRFEKTSGPVFKSA